MPSRLSSRSGLPRPLVADSVMQQWLDIVSEVVARNPDNTNGNLVGALRQGGLLDREGNLIGLGETTLPAGVPSLGISPVPSGFTARAGIGVVVLFWDNPFAIYSNHAVARVFRYTADEFNNAVQVGMSTGISYVDTTPSSSVGETLWYWVRWETTGSVLGQPTAGLEVNTSPDPAVVIPQISQSVIADPLTMALLAPVAGDRSIEASQRIAQRVADRISAVQRLIDESLSNVLVTRITGAEGTLAGHTIDINALEARIAGVNLGPVQNEFTGDDRTAAETARDEYAAANAAWLAEYDADSDLNIRLVYGVVQQYQNREGMAWEDNGEPSPSASAVSLISSAAMQNAADILTNAEAITGLSGQIGGKAEASVVDLLDARVAETEGSVETNTTSLTALTTNVEGKADTSAVTALTGRVTENEDDIAANASEITALSAAIAGVELGPEQNLFTGDDRAAAEEARDDYALANPLWLPMYDASDSLSIRLEYGVLLQYQRRIGDVWVDSGEPLARAAALTGLNTSVMQNAAAIEANAASITQLMASVAAAATVAALEMLATRVTDNEDGIEANAASITQLMADVGAAATAAALAALVARVTMSEAGIAANAAEITALEASIGGRALGPEQNVFVGSDRVAAETARDEYETANPTWLAEYDADDDINIELRWGVLYVYQRRVNMAWIDNGEPLAQAAAVTQLNTQAMQQSATLLTHAEQLTSLTAMIAGRATVAALNALTAMVEANATGIETNATAITALDAGIDGRLGPEENEFAGATSDAAEAARDAYALANPDWLAQYDANPDNMIELNWT